jgi:hypothetical protein
MEYHRLDIRSETKSQYSTLHHCAPTLGSYDPQDARQHLRNIIFNTTVFTTVRPWSLCCLCLNQFAPHFYVTVRIRKREYLLTPRSKVLLGNLIVAQLVKKVTASYSIQKVNRLLFPWTVSYSTQIQPSTATYPTFLSSIFSWGHQATSRKKWYIIWYVWWYMCMIFMICMIWYMIWYVYNMYDTILYVYDIIWYVWHDMIWHDMYDIWYMTWLDIWYDDTWYYDIWYDII